MAIVLAYLLVSIGVIVAFVGAVFTVGWFIGRQRERRRGRRAATAQPRARQRRALRLRQGCMIPSSFS
jgi:hypothetical protein